MSNADKRLKYVTFADDSTKESFGKLKEGKFEDRELFRFINRALDDLKENPFVGVKVPKRLWPKEYIQKYRIRNLWKYDLPNGWRLIYAIRGNALEIVAIVLEWFSHKDYERKFGY